MVAKGPSPSGRSAAFRERLELDAAVQRVAEIVLAGANHHLARRGAVGDQVTAQLRRVAFKLALHIIRALQRQLLVDLLRTGPAGMACHLDATVGLGRLLCRLLRDLLQPDGILAAHLRIPIELRRARLEQEFDGQAVPAEPIGYGVTESRRCLRDLVQLPAREIDAVVGF
jgi:hypothetical protein